MGHGPDKYNSNPNIYELMVPLKKRFNIQKIMINVYIDFLKNNINFSISHLNVIECSGTV